MSATPRTQFHRFCLTIVVLACAITGINKPAQANSIPGSLWKTVTYNTASRPAQLPSKLQAKLLADDKATFDNLGYSVSISADGNTIIMGAPYESDSGTTNNGAAYVFIRSGINWTQQAKLLASDKADSDYFGWSVSISADGNTALIGAPGEDDSGTTGNGAVYVFIRSGTTWTQQAKLLGSDKATDDLFGRAVSISADSNTALIGAELDDDGVNTNNGAAYVFVRAGITWTQQAKLFASDKATDDVFGRAVSISTDGNLVLIGAEGHDKGGQVNAGAAYVFTRSGTMWTQQTQLQASDLASNEQFGSSVALSGNGDTALIGAKTENDSGTFSNGAGYVFVHVGMAWNQQAKLLASDKSDSDYLGNSVALSVDGNTALIGAFVEDDSSLSNNGAAYVFTRNGSTWVQQVKLLANDRLSFDYFGNAVGLSADGNTALIGAPGEDDSGTTENGAAYIFIQSPIDTIGIYRPSNQTYYLRNTNTTGGPDISVQYGYLCGVNVCNYPIVGDWNGDGIDTIGLYDQTTGVFLLRDANVPGAPTYSFVLGNPSDQPMAGRWTSDMTHDGAGVFRPSNGILYLKKNLTTGFSDYFAVMGNPGDVGLAGDWNADGLDSVGVYRPSQSRFYMTNNNQPSGITFSDLDFLYGDGSQDKPFVGDWTGNGTSKPGVYRNGTVMLRNSLTGGAPDLTFSFGAAGDMPLAGKWVAGSQPPNAHNVVLPGIPFVNPADPGQGD